jgi:ParB family chromosome partitioning protein
MATKRKPGMDLLSLAGSKAGSLQDGLKYELPLEKLVPRRGQPRKHWGNEELQALAATLGELGMIQPIVVRPVGEKDGERFEIVVGERRWRAAQLAQLATVPVIVRYLDDGRTALYSLAENMARCNLNPIEQARGYDSVVEEHQLTQTELAEAIGQNVKTVNRILRLLKLPKEIP